jgi:hypothetical protein
MGLCLFERRHGVMDVMHDTIPVYWFNDMESFYRILVPFTDRFICRCYWLTLESTGSIRSDLCFAYASP